MNSVSDKEFRTHELFNETMFLISVCDNSKLSFCAKKQWSIMLKFLTHQLSNKLLKSVQYDIT